MLTHDRFFKTGDLGKVDDDGFLFITGRKKDMIIVAGGEGIPPRNRRSARPPRNSRRCSRAREKRSQPRRSRRRFCHSKRGSHDQSRRAARFLPRGRGLPQWKSSARNHPDRRHAPIPNRKNSKARPRRAIAFSPSINLTHAGTERTRAVPASFSPSLPNHTRPPAFPSSPHPASATPSTCPLYRALRQIASTRSGRSTATVSLESDWNPLVQASIND